MRSSPVLAVLLFASLLANAVLAVRLSRVPEPAPAPARKAPPTEPAAEKKEDVASLRESLDQERKKAAELQARIERLETDKKVLAQEAPGAAKTDKLAAFREKLRKLMKLMKDPAAKAGALDPEMMAEATETMMEFMRLAALRAKEPKTYADYLHAFYEIGLEGEGTSLTPPQSAELTRLLHGFGEELARIPPAPAGESLLRQLEVEKGVMTRLKDVLTEPQRKALAEDNMEVLSVGNLMSTTYITRAGAADQIAKQWSALYQLDAAQLPAAQAAAQAYVEALGRIDGPSPGGIQATRSSSPEAYDRRIASLREQLAALQRLQGSMTPAQQERLRTQTMREILILDGAVTSEAPPAEK